MAASSADSEIAASFKSFGDGESDGSQDVT